MINIKRESKTEIDIEWEDGAFLEIEKDRFYLSIVFNTTSECWLFAHRFKYKKNSHWLGFIKRYIAVFPENKTELIQILNNFDMELPEFLNA